MQAVQPLVRLSALPRDGRRRAAPSSGARVPVVTICQRPLAAGGAAKQAVPRFMQ